MHATPQPTRFPGRIVRGVAVLALGPEDDCLGRPATWRKFGSIPNPEVTVQYAENATSADHIMAHFWTASGDAADLDSSRHRGRANYFFVDSHAEKLHLGATYSLERSIDRWHPALAAAPH
jgi:prepilin-type processing-associated H-X9-DG protein